VAPDDLNPNENSAKAPDSAPWRSLMDEVGLFGSSPSLISAVEMAFRCATSTSSVLILGENGTGKELLARFIHRASRRAKGPFIAVNCAAIPDNLLESLLFGHEVGAFTGAVAQSIGAFELASRGTLFLDEIGDMSPNLQSKILRALQEREIQRVGSQQTIPVDIRVIAATHQALDKLIKQKRFREDLYYRLCVVPIQLPPLRKRRDDIAALSDHFLKFFWERNRPDDRLQPPDLADSALRVLSSRAWRGNVRELKNVIERLVALTESGSPLPLHLLRESTASGSRGGKRKRTSTLRRKRRKAP
jgi:transcriptional regulator with PAS, ATPase and Fis domain